MRPASAWHAAASIPARARQGGPGHITARLTAAAITATTIAAFIPGTPAAPADITAVLLWLALTSSAELAPPRQG